MMTSINQWTSSAAGKFAALLFFWSLVLAGPVIFLHEAGHFLAGLTYGEDVRMTASSVISNTPATDYPPLQRVVQTGMGPIVSVVLTLIGIALIGRFRAFGLALAITAPARFIFSVGFLGVLAYRALSGLPPPSPSFDEHTVMTAIALPLWPLLVGELIFLIWVWRTVHRAMPDKRRWLAWGALIAGTVAGIFAWLGLVGPALLN
ncbi:hypothetical protein NAP1_07780 [Erythrobacter sp. NAP1]|uniref:hypothetical protein n=1 Tax=Erythrobacter sp. NAP1 TaxID=237727 RepID=UPI0000686E37|nr:hypothetical protein [Erythrobacter sp. NAP1]EAQ30662.1 hypothetical protein NAP1_07780 [Erythrobacter sp. NAP1]